MVSSVQNVGEAQYTLHQRLLVYELERGGIQRDKFSSELRSLMTGLPFRPLWSDSDETSRVCSLAQGASACEFSAL